MQKIEFTLNNEIKRVSSYHNTYFLPYPCESNSDCYPYVSVLPSGLYILEVWGAQGGSFNETIRGGKGGYSRGLLRLRTPTKAFFYVGGAGIESTEKLEIIPVSFNGGGSGRSSENQIATSGGGASDIRLKGDSLYHRVIVAGGGGGTGYFNYECSGGVGGGLTGEDGMPCWAGCAAGTKGTQTQGGITASSGVNGKFGYGGNKTTWDGCGGGGGWFGGGAGSSYISAGGGGSGFVFNEESYSNAKSQGLLLSSRYLLTDAFLFSGNEEFPAFNSFVNETGHESNGAISITLLQVFHCTKKTNAGRNNVIYASLII